MSGAGERFLMLADAPGGKSNAPAAAAYDTDAATTAIDDVIARDDSAVDARDGDTKSPAWSQRPFVNDGDNNHRRNRH